ncbi:MAG TPA: HD domain-containing protein [Burkholderiaceae bacterium]|nr:HD domain-containing protein [Burkholderiaceae bacterium]
MDAIDDIERLFAQHGGQLYDGQLRESVTALEHSLQCAQLAEWAQADSALVVAALLHDIGHFVDPMVGDRLDDEHERRAAALLAPSFPAAVVEPARLHVQAKRYLVATDARYLAGLSSASVHSLGLQGGPMSADECRRFEAMPFAEDAVLLRRWDDSAKIPGRKTPPLAYYMSLLREHYTAAASDAPRTVVGSLDV